MKQQDQSQVISSTLLYTVVFVSSDSLDQRLFSSHLYENVEDYYVMNYYYIH